MLYPSVWLEDGFINLLGFLTRGISSFIEPQNGYYFLLPKLITSLSASISVYFYPEIATAFTVIITVAILICIARLPLYLRGGFWLPIFCLLIPCKGEGFGLPSYIFWWSSLLLLVFVFWDKRAAARYVWARIIAIGLASLSAPVCLVTLPLFWARIAFFWKQSNRNTEIHIACWATVFAAIQLIPTWAVATHNTQQNIPAALGRLDTVIAKFIGHYVLANLFPQMALTLGIVVLLYIVVSMFRHWRNIWLWALCYLWLVAIAMSLARRTVLSIDPIMFASRYFFLPYILLGWLILQFAYVERNKWLRCIPIMLIIFSAVNAVPSLLMMEKPDDFRWRSHLMSCQHFPYYIIPIVGGGRGDAGGRGQLHYAAQISLPREKCSQIDKKDVFGVLVDGEGRKTFPYASLRFREKKPSTIIAPTAQNIIANQWQRQQDWPKIALDEKADIPPGWEAFASFSNTGANNNGVLSIRLHRGDSLMFAAGTKTDHQTIEIAGHPEFVNTTPFWAIGSRWALLEFSSDLLPETFVVNFHDSGDEPSEWSAVALKMSAAASSQVK